MDRERAQLVEHVRDVQRNVRTCEGCGLCCTEAYNSVRILPVEASRIASHLAALPEPRQKDLVARIEASIAKYRLRPRTGRQPYTCPFLESDFSCALPFDVKPVACLAFNPISADRCEMDVRRFDAAHAHASAANEQAGRPSDRLPIPVAVLSAMKSTTGSKSRSAGGAPVRERASASSARGKSSRHPLPRVLSKWRFASRAEAETLVRAGRVAVNGSVVRDVVRRVDAARDRISVDGTPVSPPDERTCAYLLLNKPRGVVTTTKDPEGRQTVMDLLGGDRAPGLAPVGRLDQDSAGVLLLTNDHALAAKLLDPVSHVRKTYRVKVKRHVDEDTLARMRTERVAVDGFDLEPFAVEVESTGPRSTWLRITLEEGKNRQIRRQCQAFGHEVEIIVRMAFGPLALGALKPGACRPLTQSEIDALRRA